MATKGIGFTQVAEYLMVDIEIVKALVPGSPTFQYLKILLEHSLPLETKVACIVSSTFVIDWLAAAPIIGNEGVKHILNRENWRGK